MTDKIVILTTVDSEDLALKIASGLVEGRLAACVNVISSVRSIYRWKDKVCDDKEMILMIKTSAHLFNEVRDLIREQHTYELPEILALPVAAGDEKVLDWIMTSVKGRTP
ncbi:MAG: divalent-cation tolerance protein CutA [Acidobacteria bacterium]|nr:divalent-cation tolerance protein CutA [Acidobacteriota bacterium]